MNPIPATGYTFLKHPAQADGLTVTPPSNAADTRHFSDFVIRAGQAGTPFRAHHPELSPLAIERIARFDPNARPLDLRRNPH